MSCIPCKFRWIFLCLLVFLLSGIGAAQQPKRVVDDAALRQAAPEEWLTYGHDWGETHYSPLKQIDTSNVQRLGLAWSYETGASGLLEATPLVSNGILYGTTSWSMVFAIDARTGKYLWHWDPMIPRSGGPSLCCGPGNRGVGLYKGKVYIGLLDGRLVALDAENGKFKWAAQTTPPGEDYSMTAAPRIFGGKVIVGNAGTEFGVRGYVTAYDAETGKQLWRTYVVPGDPSKPYESKALEFAAKTWNPKSEYWKIGGGGAPWSSFSYDPEADLVYVATGNGAPWNDEIRSPGATDCLYISSILALKGSTGEQVWYYQTTPGDSWDFDNIQNMVLADLPIGGQQRKVLMQATKSGFFYVIDRITGEVLSGEPFVPVTWTKGMDKKTWRPLEIQRYGLEGQMVSPGPAGGHNWNPMAYSPITRLVYIPAQDTSYFFQRERNFKYQKGRNNWGVARSPLRPPDSPQPGDSPTSQTVTPPVGVDAHTAASTQPQPPRREGRLLAWDPITQKEVWRVTIPKLALNGGVLATGGNLVFSGTAAGLFTAHSADKGVKLWEMQLASGFATPITYELDGKQYVSVMAGRGGAEPSRVWTFVLDGKEPMPALKKQP